MEGAAESTSVDEQLRKAAADAMMDIGGGSVGAAAAAPAPVPAAESVREQERTRMLQEAARRVEERRARSESPSRVAAGFLPTAASVAGATPGAASGPARSEDEATSQLEAMMRAWGDSSFYEPIVQTVLDNSPVITPLSAKQVVKMAIKKVASV